MFNKSIIKIVATVVISLFVFFTGIITAIYCVSRASMHGQNEERLDRYVETYVLGVDTDAFPIDGSKGGIGGNAGNADVGFFPPKEKPMGYELSVFYSVAFAPDGSVLEVRNQKSDVITDGELIEKATVITAKNGKTGTVDSLSFKVEKKNGYTLVAFIDESLMNGNMSTLLKYTIIGGGAGLIGFFFLSLFIAKRIVKPLKENDERQKRFISDAGHELKTPVSVVSANVELLSREIGDDQWLNNIRYENERMSALITDLLDLSRAESGKQPFETVDFTRLVVGEVLPFESLAFDKGVLIKEHLENGITVNGNPTQLKQLVAILIDNALSHGEGEITVSLKKHRREVLLEVENIGDIPSDKIDKLFERFYRADDSRTGDGKNYGLGLAIAKAITESHGGRIEVRCKDNKVAFSIYLPA